MMMEEKKCICRNIDGGVNLNNIENVFEVKRSWFQEQKSCETMAMNKVFFFFIFVKKKAFVDSEFSYNTTMVQLYSHTNSIYLN
jgi:hypothetical protein